MKQEKELYAFRRHVQKCPHFGPGGREIRTDKCTCPFHADGVYQGERVRKSLKTRSRQYADVLLNRLMKEIDERLAKVSAGVPAPEHGRRTVPDAVSRFLTQRGSVGASGYKGDGEYGTFRKYRNTVQKFASFCDGRGIRELAFVTLEHLEDYRRTREIAPVTWKVELQTLRTFFTYCVRHKWITVNPASDLRPPRNLKPNEVIPYTFEEEDRIMAAALQFGGGRNGSSGDYERLRAEAMTMLLRQSALRVSDVCTLAKDALVYGDNAWRIRIRTLKSGEPVYLPITNRLKTILDALPLPRNAARDCRYFFWNGITSRRAVVGIAERTLSAVFRRSGVKNAHAHRFRHTLATRLLEQGATFEQVADILGNSPEVVRKHYAKWSRGCQDGIDRLMNTHFATMGGDTKPVTNESHEKTPPVNSRKRKGKNGAERGT